MHRPFSGATGKTTSTALADIFGEPAKDDPDANTRAPYSGSTMPCTAAAGASDENRFHVLGLAQRGSYQRAFLPLPAVVGIGRASCSTLTI